MISIKNEAEIALMKQSCQLVSQTLGELAKHIKSGVTTKRLDRIAEEYIRDHGGQPGFLNYQGYPATLCTSINDEVVHGIPGDRVIEEGDIVSVDCGVLLNGYYGDSAYTFAVGEVGEDVVQLMEATKKALYLGIENAVEGSRLGDISYSIQHYVESRGYSVVREMVGHGIGRKLHEDPQVPNYGQRGRGTLLKEGYVLAIEPMINMGKKEIRQLNDGWTIKTKDGKKSAHYEHTVAVRKAAAEILTTFDFIEEALKAKN